MSDNKIFNEEFEGDKSFTVKKVDICKTSTELYLKRIRGLILPLKPNFLPFNYNLSTLPNFKAKYNDKTWHEYLKNVNQISENEKISHEAVLQKLSDVGFTIHYLSRVKDTMFKEVVNALLEEIKK
ncbi:10475_t:CDS:2, partial [Racocetra persica]